MATALGTKIVLTASATEMSDFLNNPFIAFVAGFGKGPIPLGFVRKTLYPPVERKIDGRAGFAPYGLRKVEAMLLQSGFSEQGRGGGSSRGFGRFHRSRNQGSGHIVNGSNRDGLCRARLTPQLSAEGNP